MTQVFKLRNYDRLLQRAAEQMTAVSPSPDLAIAAQEAGTSLEEAQTWFADDHALSVAVVKQQMVLLTGHLRSRLASCISARSRRPLSGRRPACAARCLKVSL